MKTLPIPPQRSWLLYPPKPWRRRVLFLLFATLSVARATADTFTHVDTGETLDGRILGTTIEAGVTKYIVKVGRDHRILPEKEWLVRKAVPKTAPVTSHPWPPMIYRNEVRTTAWLNRTYVAVRDRFTVVGASFIDLRAPVVENKKRSTRLRTPYGNARLRLTGLVSKLLGETGITLLVDVSPSPLFKQAVQLHVVRIDNAGIRVGDAWSGLVVRMTYHKPRDGKALTDPQKILENNLGTFYVPFPEHPEPLTPEQFMALLKAGVDVVTPPKR